MIYSSLCSSSEVRVFDELLMTSRFETKQISQKNLPDLPCKTVPTDVETIVSVGKAGVNSGSG